MPSALNDTRQLALLVKFEDGVTANYRADPIPPVTSLSPAAGVLLVGALEAVGLVVLRGKARPLSAGCRSPGRGQVGALLVVPADPRADGPLGLPEAPDVVLRSPGSEHPRRRMLHGSASADAAGCANLLRRRRRRGGLDGHLPKRVAQRRPLHLRFRHTPLPQPARQVRPRRGGWHRVARGLLVPRAPGLRFPQGPEPHLHVRGQGRVPEPILDRLSSFGRRSSCPTPGRPPTTSCGCCAPSAGAFRTALSSPGRPMGRIPHTALSRSCPETSDRDL